LFSSNSIPAFAVTGGVGGWLNWPVLPGKTYRVQFKNALNDPAWQDLGQAFSVVGDRAYIKEVNSQPGQRFYRVLAY